MATETKNHTSEKPDVEALQKSRTSVPDNLSTDPNNNPSSTNSSKLSSPASPLQNASGDLTEVGAGPTGGEDSKDGASQAAVSASGGAGPATDVEKKLRRAERFGVPVKLSEQEKRSSRAERFGSGSGSGPGSDPSKSLEDQKRKARAERFGLAPTSVSTEESKKKARLARFGSDIKTGTKADSLEEEKRKARALRFAQPSAGSLSQLNGEGNKTTVASKAIGGI